MELKLLIRMILLTSWMGFQQGQNVSIDVIRYEDGTSETINVNLTDKYAYYIELGMDAETLDSMGVEEGDAFLGVQNLAGGYCRC